VTPLSTVGGGGEADAEPAVIGEPLHGVADGAAVDDAGAYAAQRVPADQPVDAGRVSRADPAQADEHATDRDHQPRTDPVDEIPLEGHQPRLGDHEGGESDLDGGERGVQVAAQRLGEERPRVLQVRDRHHRHDPGDKLHPAADDACLGLARGLDDLHGSPPQVRSGKAPAHAGAGR